MDYIYINYLKEAYSNRREIIKNRLKYFKTVFNENDKRIFAELCFCLLTPQSNAFKCHEGVCILRDKDFINKSFDVKPILRDKTRFYKNKSSYLIYNKKQYDYIKNCILNKSDGKEIRELLVRDVKGLGYKEASHFLRNIGYRGLAILDRHILKNLQKLKVIDKIHSSLNKKDYLSIEGKFYKFSKRIKINMDELDLLFWSMETGKVFK